MVVASNAPSVTVLPLIRRAVDVPVLGVFPPIEEALRLVKGDVVVLGAASLVTSYEMRAYVVAHAGTEAGRVRTRAASDLIDVVEHTSFLTDPDATERAVAGFVDVLRDTWPNVAAITLSSTHLPWLRPFFERADPTLILLDPADATARAAVVHASRHGRLSCLVTEREGLSAADFTTALRALADAGGPAPSTPVVIPPLSGPRREARRPSAAG